MGVGKFEKSNTPVLQHSITPILSDDSLGSEGDEIVVVHTQLVHVNFLVVLAEQRCGSINAAGSFHQPRDHAELLVLADHRVLHEMRRYKPEDFYNDNFVRELDKGGFIDSLYD